MQISNRHSLEEEMALFSPWRSLILAAFLLPFAASAQSTCGSAEGVRIAFGNTLAPFAFAENGTGIEIDIIRESFRRQGCKVVPVFMPFLRFGYALSENKVDGAATINERSRIPAAYSDVYIEYHNVAITLASRRLSVNRIDDLKKFKVITFPGASRYFGEEFRRFSENNPHYREEPKQLHLNRLLYSGAFDVTIVERSIYAYQDRFLADGKFTERKLPVTVHPLFPISKYQIGFRDPALRDKFNLGFASLSKDDLKAIHDRYR
jgi:polar amino acid transport system substrate-binding protein